MKSERVHAHESQKSFKTVFERKLSPSLAMWAGLTTALGTMLLIYIFWHSQTENGYPIFTFVFMANGELTFHLIVASLLSVLSGLFVYQGLINKLKTIFVKQTTARLKTLFQNIPGTSYRVVIDTVLNIEARVEFLSDACTDLTGYAPDHFIKGKLKFIDLIDEADRNSVIQIVSEAIDRNQMYDFECRIHTKNSGMKWVWHRGRGVGYIDKNEIRIEGSVSDITDRKQAELALIEAQAYSEAVVDTAIEAVITIDSNGIIERFNRSAESMFAYTQNEIVGKSINLLMPQAFKDKHNDYIKEYVKTDIPKIIGVGREMTAVKKDGSIFPVDISISEVYHQKQRTFVGLIRDISQQRAAENEARIHREQLAHVDRLNVLGEMASGIAHEINQPLAAISLYAQAGRRLLDSGRYERVPEVFDKLSKQAQRAGAIIERIQSMARQHESEKKSTSCHALITEVAQLAEAEARIHDIEIDVIVAPKLPAVMVDVVQIQQVILNLLRNGMQSMRAINCCKGNRITLSASLVENLNVQIAVIDSGQGVASDYEKKLFEPFSTTKETGMGMGLSISRAIIEAHDGHIDFKNNEKFGATFYFVLPTNKRDN